MPAYSDFSDSELTVLLKQGDRLAFTEIYNRYWDKLLAIGYNHARNKEIAEEIVQDVLMSLWSRRNSVEVDRLAAYLATAVKFAVFKVLAKESRRKALLAGQLTDNEPSLDEAAIEAVHQWRFQRGRLGYSGRCRDHGADGFLDRIAER